MPSTRPHSDARAVDSSRSGAMLPAQAAVPAQAHSAQLHLVVKGQASEISAIARMHLEQALAIKMPARYGL